MEQIKMEEKQAGSRLTRQEIQIRLAIIRGSQVRRVVIMTKIQPPTLMFSGLQLQRL